MATPEDRLLATEQFERDRELVEWDNGREVIRFKVTPRLLLDLMAARVWFGEFDQGVPYPIIFAVPGQQPLILELGEGEIRQVLRRITSQNAIAAQKYREKIAKLENSSLNNSGQENAGPPDA